MHKAFILLLSLIGATTASAVGIPPIDLVTPIKISESKSYRCDSDGKGYLLKDGKWLPIRLSDGDITCHDNHFWFEEKPLGFKDLLSLMIKDDFFSMTKQEGYKNEK